MRISVMVRKEIMFLFSRSTLTYRIFWTLMAIYF